MSLENSYIAIPIAKTQRWSVNLLQRYLIKPINVSTIQQYLRRSEEKRWDEN